MAGRGDEGDVVYADIPYENTSQRGYGKGTFDKQTVDYGLNMTSAVGEYQNALNGMEDVDVNDSFDDEEETDEESDVMFSLGDEGAEESAEELSEEDKELRDGINDWLRGTGFTVETSEDVGQRVLDAARREDVREMGSRVERRKRQLASEIEGLDLSDSQQIVADVFTGRKNNAVLNVTASNGEQRRVTMRQGNEQGAGTKHSLYRHYGTTEGYITAEDILTIPDVLSNGERTEKRRGKTRLYEYRLTADDGTRKTVLTEVDNHGHENFADFYTNRKASTAARKTHSEEAQTDTGNALSGAKLQKIGGSDKFSPVFYSNALHAVEGIKQKKATAEQWLAMIQKAGGLKAGEDKWLGLSDWLNERQVSRLKQTLLLYNHRAQDSANGQMDIFSGGVKTKEEIIDEVKQLLGNATRKEQQEQLDAATADRKRRANEEQVSEQPEGQSGAGESLEQTTPAGRGDEGDGVKKQRGDDGGAATMTWQSGTQGVTREEKELRDGINDWLRGTGFTVETSEDVGQRVLDEVREMEELLQMSKRKSASETAIAQSSEEERHNTTDISNADGAKLLKEIENLAKKYEEKSNRPRTFLQDVAEAIGAKEYGTKSKYVTIKAKNGLVVTIRLANHNTTVSQFDYRGEEEGVSIVVSKHSNEGITNDGEAHVVEFFYREQDLRKAEGKPLVQIIRSVEQMLYSGEYKDTTGLAVPQEVNERTLRHHRGDGRVFYSNAEHAVEGIKQKKATAEQWLAMIQKAGGLKAGEDKWLGLSDWLNERKGKSLTKEDVLGFIRENQVEGQPMFFRTKDGEVYGYTMDGKIYIDPRVATAETPVHEYVHLWAESLMKANPEAWARLREQILGQDDVLAYVKRLYPELEGDELVEEVFAHFAGRRGAERLRQERDRAARSGRARAMWNMLEQMSMQ